VRRDRLALVVRVRELAEHRRLAERAAAATAVREAVAARAAAADAYDGHRPDPGPTRPAVLTAHRLAGVALGEDVERTVDVERLADRDLELAEARRVEAAVARRSVERLADRQRAAAAVAAIRAADRQMDDLALQRWRAR
jgi:hypothetical protein